MLNLDWETLRLTSDENLPWERYDEIQKEAKEARRICSEACSIVEDAQLRYKKKKLSARSKKQASDMKLMFADIEGYKSEEDIRDTYGWDFITEKEMDRLMELWRAREEYLDENGQYSDPVIDLLQDVMKKFYEPYSNLIALADRMNHISETQKREKILKAMITKMF